jgi:lysyl-tRNA synthetase class 2
MIDITYQFELIQAIRNYFVENNFTDVLTPPIVENPGMETHIHPFQLNSIQRNELQSLFLHTSPEFNMKKLLAENPSLTNIFSVGYAFRDEPESPIHRNQFLMLEWYRQYERYEKIMNDTENLIDFSNQSLAEKGIITKNKSFSFQRTTVDNLFNDFLGFSILDFLDKKELINKIKLDFRDIPMPNIECDWDDYYFLLFLNKIENELVNYPYLLISEYPAPLSALSTISSKDERVCERFEIYMSGIELCNCFNEITDPIELEKRFKFQASEKKRLYNYELPWPTNFMHTMKKYPKSSGIALGVERLLTSLVEVKNPFFH